MSVGRSVGPTQRGRVRASVRACERVCVCVCVRVVIHSLPNSHSFVRVAERRGLATIGVCVCARLNENHAECVLSARAVDC